MVVIKKTALKTLTSTDTTTTGFCTARTKSAPSAAQRVMSSHERPK